MTEEKQLRVPPSLKLRRDLPSFHYGMASRWLREAYAFAFSGMWFVISSRKSSLRLA